MQYLIDIEKGIDAKIDALVKEIQDFKATHNFARFYLGVSGGIDCATVAALCKRAGVEVVAVSMPYHAANSNTRSAGLSDAEKQCATLDIPLYQVDISAIADALITSANTGVGKENKLAKANVLPRIRMTTLYYLAQSNNACVIGTGNLSEIVMGYFTKWGDGAYDFDPLTYATKTEVRLMAKRLGVIDEILTKAPSADLWDGQSDEDELGLSYEDIDRYILTGHHPDNKVVERIKQAIASNRHKFPDYTEIHAILDKLA